MSRITYVGKNVARILNREFPIDTNLAIQLIDKNSASWNVSVQGGKQKHGFTPVKDDEVTVEAFRTYHDALATAVTQRKSKLRDMLGIKTEGVKIVPGHGVFILPAKMVVVKRGQRDVGIRVFTGTKMERIFRNSSNDLMVDEAAEYYHKYVKIHTDEVNQSLWHPIRYEAKPRVFEGIEMPQGVFAYHYSKTGTDVFFSSPAEGRTMYFAHAKNLRELKAAIASAAQRRHEELAGKASYRYVKPAFIPLSTYMRTL